MKHKVLGKSKFRLLCRDLGWGAAYARGVLDCLCEFIADECPRGDIGSMSDDEIALGMCLEPSDEARFAEVLRAMIERQWIARHDEHRLVFVEWASECPNFVKQRLARAGQSIIDLSRHEPAADTNEPQPMVPGDDATHKSGAQQEPTAPGARRCAPPCADVRPDRTGQEGKGQEGMGGDGEREESPLPPSESKPPLKLAGTGETRDAEIAAVLSAWPTESGNGLPADGMDRRNVLAWLGRVERGEYDGLDDGACAIDGATVALADRPLAWMLARVRLYAASRVVAAGCVMSPGKWFLPQGQTGTPRCFEYPELWNAGKGGNGAGVLGVGGGDVPYRSVLDETPEERHQAEVMR